MKDFETKIDNDTGSAGQVDAEEYNSTFEEQKNAVLPLQSLDVNDNKQLQKSIFSAASSMFYEDVSTQPNFFILRNIVIDKPIEYHGMTLFFRPKMSNDSSPVFIQLEGQTQIACKYKGNDVSSYDFLEERTYLAKLDMSDPDPSNHFYDCYDFVKDNLENRDFISNSINGSVLHSNSVEVNKIKNGHGGVVIKDGTNSAEWGKVTSREMENNFASTYIELQRVLPSRTVMGVHMDGGTRGYICNVSISRPNVEPEVILYKGTSNELLNITNNISYCNTTKNHNDEIKVELNITNIVNLILGIERIDIDYTVVNVPSTAYNDYIMSSVKEIKNAHTICVCNINSPTGTRIVIDSQIAIYAPYIT